MRLRCRHRLELHLAGRLAHTIAFRIMTAAEAHLRRAIEIDPNMLPAYRLLGSLYLSQQKLDQARKEFETLASRQSNPVSALTMTGVIRSLPPLPWDRRWPPS